MSAKNNNHRFILLAVFAFAAVPGVLLFIRPAAIFPDPSWGFLVLRSMQMGSAFNTLVSVNPDDIATNITAFVSWWSPGQYLVPYLFKQLFSLNTGHAAALTITLCQLAGLAGFYAFFKRAGFNPFISALSLVLIICQQAFFTPYIFYNGGEVLLFAFSGWFLYGCLSFNDPGIKLVLFVLLSGWIGFFCKSSFIWMYAAGLLFIWLQPCKGQQRVGNWVLKSMWPGIPSLISLAVIYFFYLSKGDNPSSGTTGVKLSWETFSFPLASPLLSGFSVDDLFHGLIWHNNVVILNYAGAITVIVVCAILSLALVYNIYKRVPNNNYKVMLIVFYAVSVIFFSYAYLNQMTISYEARHFRIIGLLIVPGTIYLFSQFKPAYRTAFGLVVILIAACGIYFYANAYALLKSNCVYGESGIAQQFIDQPSLNYITKLDKQNNKALFVFMSADIGLEVTHNRVINLAPLNDDISIDFDEYIHKGYGGGPIYILLPTKYMGIRASVILKCFPGYKGFSLRQISDDYVLYYAKEAR